MPLVPSVPTTFHVTERSVLEHFLEVGSLINPVFLLTHAVILEVEGVA
jgi:hypothetical protein